MAKYSAPAPRSTRERRPSSGRKAASQKSENAAASTSTASSIPFGAPLQRKLVVGPARDGYEVEADRVADAVVNRRGELPSITPHSRSFSAQRANAEDEEIAQTKGALSSSTTPVQRALRDETDEEPVQRNALPKEMEEKPAQRAARNEPEEEPVQRAVRDEGEEETAQREALGATNSAAPAQVNSGVEAARGGGSPLSPPLLGEMEHAFGRDFSSVRLHDDSRSHRLNQDLNAHAFTTGSDVFFARGAFSPRTSQGRRLLAHELTHVVQQGGRDGIRKKTIQRQSTGTSPSPTATGTETENSAPLRSWQDRRNRHRGVDLDGPNGVPLYRLPSLSVPIIGGRRKGVSALGSISGGFHPGRGSGNTFLPSSGVFHWLGRGKRTVQDAEGRESNTSQVQLWERYIQDNSTIAAGVERRFAAGAPKIFRDQDESRRVYYLRSRRSNSFTAIGTSAELAASSVLLRPSFDSNGKFALMDVDHFIEIQLGGAHQIGNLWLLDSATNRASGREIKDRVVKDLNKLVSDAAREDFWTGTNPSKPNFRSWPHDAHIDFARVRGNPRKNGKYWDKDRIASGAHLSKLRRLTDKEMAAEGFRLGPKDKLRRINIFLGPQSSFRRPMKVDGENLTYRGRRGARDFIRGFDLEEATYSRPETLEAGRQIATLRGTAFGNRTVPVKNEDGTTRKSRPIEAPELRVPVFSTVDFGYGGFIDRAYINRKLTAAAAARFPGASPLTFQTAGINDAWELTAEARVAADNPLFPGFEFAVRAQGDAIFVEAPIPTERLRFGPFRVTEANLQLGFDTNGLFLGGNAAFELDGVGKGTIEARRLDLAGTFSFDIDAFDPAEIAVAYRNRQWTATAFLGIKPDTIPFIDRGTISVTVDENGFSMNGTAELAGPGVPEGTQITIAYDAVTGALTLGGLVVFNTAAIPGVSDARVEVTVSRQADGTWSVAGRGSAALALPGITGQVSASYRDGILRIDGNATLSRPPMSGTAEFHASNQPVDDENQPTEGPPRDTFRVWGGGTATIQFGQYLTGTVGIQFLENGEVELLGRIALPPRISLVDAEDYHQDLVDFPEVRFPILGFTIPVIRRSFGVFGFVRGGLDANLSVGPGELLDSEVQIQYNPDRPEETQITGGSRFEIGASAEVSLSVTGGIGVGLGIVDATGEIGIRAGLGVNLTGGASVAINWTPNEGLELDATVFGEAQPEFNVSLIAKAEVVVDAFLWSGTLWDRSWNKELARIGPNLTLRAELPTSWSERHGLDVDLDKLDITEPDINVRQLAKDVFDAVI